VGGLGAYCKWQVLQNWGRRSVKVSAAKLEAEQTRLGWLSGEQWKFKQQMYTKVGITWD